VTRFAGQGWKCVFKSGSRANAKPYDVQAVEGQILSVSVMASYINNRRSKMLRCCILLIIGYRQQPDGEPPMSMFVRYIEEARRTIVRAKHEADRFGSLEIDPEHILLALLSDPVLISRTMQEISEKEILETINAHLPRREPNTLPHDLELSRAAREALVLAEGEADRFGHRYLQNEHILLGLVESGDCYAGELLKQRGLSAEKLRLQIKALPDVQEPTRRSNRSQAESELIRRIGELISQQEGQSALQLLDDYMAKSGQDRKLRIRSLGHFAALTAVQLGDLNTARRYCDELVGHNPGDPMALYVLADCLARQGETDEARRRSADCRKAALSQGEMVRKVMVELLEKRFPDFKVEP
jgi:tetratricopeptide (TPR) repeat protein